MTLKPYPNNKNYLISDDGQVFSLYSNKFLKQKIRKGYYAVGIRINNQTKTKYIHQLVAETYLKKPDDAQQINHKDENLFNNNVSNLEWCTCVYNANYGARNFKISQKRTGKSYRKQVNYKNKKSIVMIDKDTKQVLATFPSCREATEQIFPNKPYMRSAINAVAIKKRKSAGGYIWEYA